jgi:competence protein ComFC
MPRRTMNSRDVLDQLLDLLFPARCMRCSRPGGKALCERCQAVLASGACGFNALEPQQGDAPVRFCESRSGGEYRGVLRRVVLEFKSSAKSLHQPLCVLMLAAAGNDPGYLSPDTVCYVPSTRDVIRQRGYNPAQVLAGRISAVLGKPLDHRLRKVRRTRQQDQVRGSSRWRNVERAFGFSGEGHGLGSVLLVDDVITTGATADSCAGTLLEAGAASVRVLTAARALIRNSGIESRPDCWLSVTTHIPLKDRFRQFETINEPLSHPFS